MPVFDTKKIAVVLGDSPVRLWGLSSAERLERQLQHASIDVWHDSLAALPADAVVMMLRADYLYDSRVIKGLAKAQQVLLEVESGGGKMVPVAAQVGAGQAGAVGELLCGRGSGNIPAEIVRVTVVQMAQGFDAALLKLDTPFVLPISRETRGVLEQLLFFGSYKGITDLVTKWLWPVPAQWATRLCVGLRISPNQVTALSLVLAILAGVLFARGEFGWGLLAGWIMTFLDTVDGKLARVTVTSSRLGNIFDHGIDLIHPPFWYLAWGIGLASNPAMAATLPLHLLYWAIFAGYIGGRLCEGAFQLWIASFSMFTWRPVDSYFRLIVARRNPNMIMLSASLALGRPDLGLVAVAGWTVLSTAVLLLRLLMAARAKMRPEGVRSWLTEIGLTVDERALAVRAFTRIQPAENKV
ncbi:MAG: CDP-alcohol phosphatidyltransferase family protein [Betaproteobacteria bacterium]|nr:CDP-alcohol phosphatidyltransferase family protein [Betaproteobacteria bacterium]